MLLSKCGVYDSKKSKLIKKEASRLISSLINKTSISKIALVGPLLF